MASSSSPSTPTTKVKFNKTSCYFCNEWFENEEIEAHLASCGQILTKCPNECGAYFTQKEMDRHLNRCPEGFGEDPKQLPDSGKGPSPDSGRIRELEQELTALRGTLNEEIRQRLSLIIDVGQLKKRSLLADEWTAKVGDVLNALKKCINEETGSRCVDIERCKIDINRLLKQYQQIDSWRSELTTRFNQLTEEVKKLPPTPPPPPPPPQPQQSSPPHRESVALSKSREAQLVMIESRLNHLQSELENLAVQRRSMVQQQNGPIIMPGAGEEASATKAAIEDIESKLQTVDVVLEDHHNSIRIFQEETKRQVFELRGEIDPMRMVIQEQLDKQAKLDYELKGVLNTVNSTEDTSDKIHKTLDKYRRETYYTKQCLDDLQVHLQHQEKLSVLQSTNGHLIWRIDQFDKRFRESQENELMIRSPLFCDRPFGYTLRLEACLNGIGTWRGRNLIVGLVVVNGYYDNLLEWPCVLTGMVTLRDQPVERKKAADFTKGVLARRKHQHYEKNQYIHIPHQVLRSEHYIKDDAIFLEVRIDH